jgi:putative NADH-flavin reductase
MKLTIFAATGRIGRQALEQALAAGHDVTAVVRNPNKLSGEAVRIVTADLAAADPAAMESAVAGAHAVLSGLGPRSTSETGIASQGTRAIIQAMQATGVPPPRLTDKPLTGGVRAEPPRRLVGFPRRRRPAHAPRARATRDHQASHRHRQLSLDPLRG